MTEQVMSELFAILVDKCLPEVLVRECGRLLWQFADAAINMIFALGHVS